MRHFFYYLLRSAPPSAAPEKYFTILLREWLLWFLSFSWLRCEQKECIWQLRAESGTIRIQMNVLRLSFSGYSKIHNCIEQERLHACACIYMALTCRILSHDITWYSLRVIYSFVLNFTHSPATGINHDNGPIISNTIETPHRIPARIERSCRSTRQAVRSTSSIFSTNKTSRKCAGVGNLQRNCNACIFTPYACFLCVCVCVKCVHSWFR